VTLSRLVVRLLLALALALALPSACSLGGPGDETGARPDEAAERDAWESGDASHDAAGDPGGDPGGDPASEPGQGHYPPTATPQQVTALAQVNRFRTACGLPTVDEEEALNFAAQAHAEFIVKNCANYANSGLSPHNEDPGWPGFTGVNFWDRTAHFGYQGMGGAEIIAFVNNPTLAVSGWMDTLYHRLPITDPATVEIGYGNAGLGGGAPCGNPMLRKADVIDSGSGAVKGDPIVLYPPAGAVAIPRSFDGYESPQPPAPPGGYPSGYIVTVQFGKKIGFEVEGHRILEAGTTPLPHVFLAPFADPEHDVRRDGLLDNALALYAHEPLAAKTDHTVVIDLIRGGKPLKLEWTFRTGAQ